MPKSTVSQFNFQRVVRTELLPYEIPYRYSYDCLDNTKHPVLRFLKCTIKNRDDNKKVRPHSFEIAKSPLSPAKRNLVILPHLYALEWCEFYKKYNQIILTLCNRSSWSIRRPVSIAKTFVFRSTKWKAPINDTFDQDVYDDERTSSKLQVEHEENDQNAISSFYVYSRHTSLHQFYNSPDLKRLERKFRFCYHVDIANCFNSIYSHSIDWAIIGKHETKATLNNQKTFGSEFDRLIRNSNYGETAGIPIGPEFSRIFSEIILQKIDVEIESSLVKIQLIDKKNYTIRRYIDDYFIFCNTEHDYENIIDSIRNELAKFNLHLNSAKTKIMNRPFVSTLSLCKKKISDCANSFFHKLKCEEYYSETKSQARSIKFVDDLRYIASEHSETFKSLVPYTLAIIRNHSKIALQNAAKPEYQNAALNRIIEICCISEELLSVCLNYRSTIIFSEIMMNLCGEDDNIESSHFPTISSFCRRLVHDLIVSLKFQKNICPADFINLFLTAKDINTEERISLEDIQLIFNSSNDFKSLSSTEICSIIYYYAGSANERYFLFHLFNAAIAKIKECHHIIADSELYGLTLDLLACPKLPISHRETLIKKIDPKSKWKLDDWGRIFSQDSFFSWRGKKSPISFLQKKTLSAGY